MHEVDRAVANAQITRKRLLATRLNEFHHVNPIAICKNTEEKVSKQFMQVNNYNETFCLDCIKMAECQNTTVPKNIVTLLKSKTTSVKQQNTLQKLYRDYYLSPISSFLTNLVDSLLMAADSSMISDANFMIFFCSFF